MGRLKNDIELVVNTRFCYCFFLVFFCYRRNSYLGIYLCVFAKFS